jgi:hypothetical protein
MKALPAVLALSLAATAAHARPFKDMCEQFEPLRRISGLKYVKPTIRVEPRAGGAKPEDVVFTIDTKPTPIRITPTAEGLIELPFTDKLCAENPDISVNQPPGMLSLGISIDPSIPPVKTLDYRLLDALRREWDEAISRQSLMWRVLAPGSKAFQIQFEAGRAASAEIRLPGGARRLAADGKGEVRIPFEREWAEVNPTIVLSELPKRIGLAFK